MQILNFIWIAAAVLIDQLTKLYISTHMTLYESIRVIENFFYITYAQNTGAAWSMGQGLGDLFAILALAVSIGLLWYYHKNRNTLSILEKWSIMLIVPGALGNMIDRIIHGYVVDFLDFYIFGYDFPIFNVADSFLTIGVGLLILDLIVNKENKNG